MSGNTVKQIAASSLRYMENQEGLILQGCGGDLQEWVEGINSLLTKAGILQAGSTWKAEAVRTFQYLDERGHHPPYFRSTCF